ncbi:MAG TPA: class I SAM-dependent methyltransferase [Chitinophagaceae bacterium]|nr:class I SAM-dependent methyltransferase [Chitinophagaceae bacterium]
MVKPTDEIGYKSLQVIAKADKFNKWMFETIAPYAIGNILEIGSGIGNLSRYFLENNYQITLSDIDPGYVRILQQQFGNFSNLHGILQIDLQHKDFQQEYASLKEGFNTIFYLNVLEHLQDENRAIKNSLFLLKDGGTLIILVPAYAILYSQMDKALQHYKRYTKQSLNKLLSGNGTTIKQSFYFNAIGIVAWLYGKLLRLETVPNKEMRFYNKLVPVSRFLDRLLMKKIGLSVISIAQK